MWWKKIAESIFIHIKKQQIMLDAYFLTCMDQKQSFISKNTGRERRIGQFFILFWIDTKISCADRNGQVYIQLMKQHVP